MISELLPNEIEDIISGQVREAFAGNEHLISKQALGYIPFLVVSIKKEETVLPRFPLFDI